MFHQPVFPANSSSPASVPSAPPPPNFLLGRLPAAPLTLKHKYPSLTITPISLEHFPSPCLTFSPPLPSPFFRFFPLFPPLCVFHFHSHLSSPLVKTYLLARLSLTSIFWPGNVFSFLFSFFLPLLVVLNRTHLHTPLSSITLSFCRRSFHLKLFMNPAKLNNTSDSIFHFFPSPDRGFNVNSHQQST